MPEDGIDPRAGNLLATDPPEHTRLRRLLTGEFTVKRIRRLEPRIVEIVDDHLDAMAAAGPPADLVSAFALPVPSLVICELLGVPYDDRAEFQGRAARQVDLSLPLEERGRVAAESRTYMGELVDRARTEPGDDMLGMLVREHGDDLARAELIGIASLLLIAGHETTANMLGLGTLALLRAPEQLALVRDEPGAVAPAIEELLRFLSVVHSGIPRTVRHDTTVGDVPVAAGELLVLSLPAANRDPAVGRAPRRPRRHPHRRPARGVRARRAPLPGRAAGPRRDGRGVPRPVPALPDARTGHPVRGDRVPLGHHRARTARAARHLVTHHHRGRTHAHPGRP